MGTEPWLQATLPPGYRLAALGRIDGSSAEAKRRAAAGAPAGLVVVAREQLAGRGRYGRSWSSPEGNLYLSLLLRPQVAADRAAQLSFVAALAVHDAVSSLAPGLTPTLKWPNDVLAGDGKLAGILLESSIAARTRLEWVVIGIGLNLLHAPVTADRAAERPASSLAALGHAGIGVGAAAEAVVAGLDRWLGVWTDGGFAPVRLAWLERTLRRGAPIAVRLPGEQISGSFADLDPDGALVVELPDGTPRRIDAGEVFVPAP